jgi:GAF domain-containing protein
MGCGFTSNAGNGSLQRMLGEVAGFAVQAIPGADGAGVTMFETGRADTVVASAPFVHEVDTIQYRLGEGPCISAASTGCTQGSGALGEEESWPTFGQRAATLGIRSVLSLPLLLDGVVLGSLNVYARARHAFSKSSRAVGELFAIPAAVAVHNARVLDQANRTAVRLQGELDTRSTIDRAVGILMARSGQSEDDAFVRLRIESQRENVKVVDVARGLVEGAVQRANTRQPVPEK